MDRITISNKQVKEIRQDGIVYLDDNGVEQFIDFEQCYQNYLTESLSLEAIEGFKINNNKTDANVPEYIENAKKWKEVAFRNSIGIDFVDRTRLQSLPYFEFHTSPPIRIEFEDKNSLREMHFKIDLELGWRTFDLT